VADGSAASDRVDPAPAGRRGDTRPWDEDTRPVAPPAPAGHVHSERGMAVGRHLVDVHDHLRGELARVRDLLERVTAGKMAVGEARGALNQMTMRQHIWTLGAYCSTYCTMLTGHHELEDGAVFPHLRDADAGLAPVLDRLEDEHRVIHGIVERVDRALVDLVGNPDDFAELREAVDVLTDAMLSHLAYEERQLVDPLARHGFFPGQV
jgi:hypothetical protein